MAKVRVGQLVEYPVGRNSGSGTVTAVDGGVATIRTRSGKTLNRSISLLKASKKAPPAPAPEDNLGAGI